MKDRGQRPTPFDSLPFKEQDQLFATAALGFFLTEEYQTKIESIDDPRFLGSLCKEDHEGFTSRLYVGNTLTTPLQGYVYLRGLADLAIGHLEERDSITYPLLNPLHYSRLRTSEKLLALEGVSTIEAILNHVPVRDWSQIRGRDLSTIPTSEQTTLIHRVDRIAELLDGKTFASIIPLWKTVATEEMGIIQGIFKTIAPRPTQD